MNVQQLFENWLQDPDLPACMKNDLLSIIEQPDEIEDRFYRGLSFGTGGMRGILGAGTNRVNIYTIRHVAEGLALHLLEQGSDAVKRGVVIAYDTRHYSRQFALEAAKTIGKYGIHVSMFSESRPTPELSFAVRHLGTAAGIVITASHNPSPYNGIKVYGPDGGQLSPFATEKIISHMNRVENILSIRVSDEESLIQKGHLHFVLENIDREYQQMLLTLQENKSDSDLTIIYTPLHGSGLHPVIQGLQNFGFTDISVVEEQALPDPDFSTVTAPNPEDPEAWGLAIQQGSQLNADLLLATDPDADRLGVAVRTEDKSYKLLSGNQLGALLLHYVLTQKKSKDQLPANGVVLKTIVTSELGRVIAQKFHLEVIDTLTGFKFISEKIEEFDKIASHTFLFGYEESFGFLIGDFVRDKDAVQAALVTAEMASFYKASGKSLIDALNELYKEFGYYKEALHSISFTGFDGHEKMNHILDRLRNQPPLSIADVPITYTEDYKLCIRSYANGETEPLLLPQADVLKFILDENAWICVRPSGTEPKCKFYFGVRTKTLEESQHFIKKLQEGFMELVKEVHL